MVVAAPVAVAPVAMAIAVAPIAMAVPPVGDLLDLAGIACVSLEGAAYGGCGWRGPGEADDDAEGQDRGAERDGQFLLG